MMKKSIEKIIRLHSLKTAILCWLLILLFCVYGCGTRKTETEKSETKTDNIAVLNSSIESTKLVLGTSFTYTPVDGLKPMVIDGRTFENAIVSGGTTNEITHTKTLLKKYNINKTYTIEKTKKTYKTDNTILWIGLFFVLCLFTFLWFYLKK